MNKDQIFSGIRWLITAFCAYGAGRGWFGADIAGYIVVGVPLIIAGIWGISDKTVSATVSKAASLVWVPESSQLNAGIPADKVKGPPPPPTST